MNDLAIPRTLSFVIDNNQILLGRKKWGFGEGKWNGFGGKVEVGETIVEGAKRELLEECGLVAATLRHSGILIFSFAAEPLPRTVHVFLVQQWSGTVQETDEMAPQWFSLSSIPYGEMWVNDAHWLPWLLAGKYFTGVFHLQDTETLLHWDIKEVAREALARHV